jgi:hypothetical protein
VDDQGRDELARVLGEIAAETGGTLHGYPRPGQPARRVVLTNRQDEQGSQYEDAVLESDGTVRISGHDRGSRVSDFFGQAITSYEWVYVVTPDRVDALVRALGGAPGDDVLALFAAFHGKQRGQVSPLLRGPEIGAQFANWHS